MPDKTETMRELEAIASRLEKNKPPKPPMKLRADKVLEEMAETFRSRNPMYGENWITVGAVMVALHPNGLTLNTADDFIRFHFLDWTIGKFTRFVNTNMTHTDSVHDAAVYMAMLEAFIKQQKEPKE